MVHPSFARPSKFREADRCPVKFRGTGVVGLSPKDICEKKRNLTKTFDKEKKDIPGSARDIPEKQFVKFKQ